MKKTNNNTNQSSVPVQHSLTAERDEAIRLANDACRFHPELEQAPPAPAPKPDTRLPIDPEARKANRTLPTQTVVERLASIPAAAQAASVVGKWVWVQFAEQPAAEIRQQLSQLGFHWNANRQAWQHPCGKFSLSRNTDPHEKYSTYRPASIRRSAKPQTAEATA
jgi:hypothetical protein